MRNVLKAETLERKFPLLAVEHGCIVSKDADLTVAFEVLLPEIYTVTGDEYEAIHSAWVKAIRVLPDYSVVCKQDWFVEETYRPDFDRDGQSFLAKSYERHFNERPYLGHRCYLYLTKRPASAAVAGVTSARSAVGISCPVRLRTGTPPPVFWKPWNSSSVS